MKKTFRILSLVLLLAGVHQANAASSDVASEHAFGHPGWKALSPGSVVYLFAPASKVTPAECTMAQIRLKTYGLTATWDKDAYVGDPSCPKRAMTPKAAFEDLIHGLKDKTVGAVWAFRGGRLSLELCELLDALPPEELSALPRKPIIGFSDISSLLLWFVAHDFPVIHGPLALFGEDAKNVVNGETTLAPTVDILMGRRTDVTYNGLVPLNDSARAVSTVEGLLVVANASSVGYYNQMYKQGPLAGRPHIFGIETSEDLGDDTRVESILAAARIGDMFKDTKAIIFGQFHGEPYTSDKFASLQERFAILMARFAGKTSIPVFTTCDPALKSFQFGHGAKNDVLPLGFPTVLTMGADPMSTTLTISGKPV